MQIPPVHPVRPVYGVRVLLGLATASCLIAVANWALWSQREARGITAGVGIVFGLPVMVIAIYDFVRRGGWICFVAMMLTVLAAAYWCLRTWLLIRPIAG